MRVSFQDSFLSLLPKTPKGCVRVWTHYMSAKHLALESHIMWLLDTVCASVGVRWLMTNL